MVLCDTNIFIEIYKGNHVITDTFKSIGQGNVALSDVSCAELLYGARNKHELHLIRQDIDKLIVLPITPTISTLAVRLVEEFSLSHNLNLPDALIAATARVHGIELYTLNVKDFRFVKDITLFNISNI